jgi:hypothetical protein
MNYYLFCTHVMMTDQDWNVMAQYHHNKLILTHLSVLFLLLSNCCVDSHYIHHEHWFLWRKNAHKSTSAFTSSFPSTHSIKYHVLHATHLCLHCGLLLLCASIPWIVFEPHTWILFAYSSRRRLRLSFGVYRQNLLNFLRVDLGNVDCTSASKPSITYE